MEIFFPGGKKVHATYKGFTIETDQPKTSGGDGTAPAPFDLFLASLGTCAGIFVLVFCQQRNLATDQIRIVQRTEVNEATHMIGKVTIEIQLPPDFPDRYREAVIRSAEFCAVAKHLQDPPDMMVYTTKQGEGE
jgi:ribosomal protein S12 methylthiotransferase accessory factor